MHKMIKTIICAVFFVPIAAAYAGQGMFIRMESYLQSAELHLYQSECVSELQNIIVPNKTYYIESQTSGLCFFKKSTLTYDLYINENFVQRYDIHLSSNASSLNPNQSLIGTLGYQINTTLFPHSGLGTQDLVMIHVQKTADSWQGKSAFQIFDLPLNQVITPGSHDSGTYGINESSFLTADAASEYLQLASDIGYKSYIAGWAKTQNLNIYDQLNVGVRYLDIRLCGERLNGEPTDSKSNVYICHTLSSVLFKQVIDEIYTFLSMPGHEREIVFIDINHLHKVNAAQLNDITLYMIEKFGEKIAYSNQFTPLSTYGDMWKQNKQVIVFVTDQVALKNLDSMFWSNDTIASPWPNTQDKNILLGAMETNLHNRNVNQFFVLQTQMTPNINDNLDGLNIFSNSPRNLLEFTGRYRLDISEWLFQKHTNFWKNGNFFIQDFVGGSL